MDVIRCESKQELGERAAADGAAALRGALAEKGEAHIIVATGASQFEMLAALVAEPGVDWSRVTAFHLDEYVGMPMSHPASFRKYLKERFVSKVELQAFHYIDGEGDVQAECARLAELIRPVEIEVAFIGIGENGHLAFNDPPADFETTDPYIVVKLDEACRRQQLGEGWFKTLEDVPERAISMSIRQIMKARTIVCSVPDERKAEAVRHAVTGPVTNRVPASILQEHARANIYLDPASASRLD